MNLHATEIRQFIDDDEAYLAWLNENPAGFVVNSNRVPVAGYLILHRPSCGFINSADRSNWTTTGYIKTCCLELRPLQEWAEQEVGGTLRPCQFCRPDR